MTDEGKSEGQADTESKLRKYKDNQRCALTVHSGVIGKILGHFSTRIAQNCLKNDRSEAKFARCPGSEGFRIQKVKNTLRKVTILEGLTEISSPAKPVLRIHAAQDQD